MSLLRTLCAIGVSLAFFLPVVGDAENFSPEQREQTLAAPISSFHQRLPASALPPRHPELLHSQMPYLQTLTTDDPGEHLPLKHSHAQVQVLDGLAKVELTQVFENRGDNSIDALYVFPASTHAAVHALEMQIGERVVRAVLQTRDAARRTYKRAKKNGYSAALLEQQRPNVFAMNLANIQPGDVIQVRLRFTESLVPEQGVYELVLPNVVGPRYVNGQEVDPPSPTRWTANPHLGANSDAPFDFSAEVALRSGQDISAIQCSHPVLIDYPNAGEALLKLAADPAHANRDLVIRYRLQGKAVQPSLLLYQQGDEKFFSLTVQPPSRVEGQDIVPREYIFIMDVSGSMNGFPLETSKKLLRDLLDELRPQDYFNVMLFAGSNGLLSPSSLPVSRSNLRKAQALVNLQSGGGGTELLSALRRALKLPRQHDASRIFVIATDGYVAIEPQAMALVRQNIGAANLFAFGIGSSVNRYLIEGLASAGQGEPFVVEDPARAKEVADRFLQYISAPVLQNIQLDFGDFQAYDVEPKIPADLFAERPIVVTGRYHGDPKGSIVLQGDGANGSFGIEIPVEIDTNSAHNSALPLLWARQRVQNLSDLQDPVQQQHRQTITDIAQRYGLLSRYTSFVAVDSEQRGSGKSRAVRQTLPLPQGMNNQGYRGIGSRGRGSGSGYGGLGGFSAGASVRSSSGPVVRGSLDKNLIQRVLRKASPSLAQCLLPRRSQDQKTMLKILVRLTIGEKGQVRAVKILKADGLQGTEKTCLLQTLRSLRFPAPAGGGIIVVNYPLQLQRPLQAPSPDQSK